MSMSIISTSITKGDLFINKKTNNKIIILNVAIDKVTKDKINFPCICIRAMIEGSDTNETFTLNILNTEDFFDMYSLVKKAKYVVEKLL